MPKIKYQFDSKTLTFKKVKLVWKQKLNRFLVFIFVTGTAAILINVVYNSFYKNPKVIQLEEVRDNLLTKYDILNDKLNEINLEVGDIQQRDDYFYRTIFELDPIPPSVREAGFGGANRYMDIEGYKNSDVMIETSKKIDKISKKLYVQ